MAEHDVAEIGLAPAEREPRSLSENAFTIIRDRIVTLTLPPGAVIDERVVMEELGLGRTPVREALHRLGQDGLVTLMHRRGRVVSEININDLRALGEIRIPLETLAARLSAERATQADRLEAESLMTGLDALEDDFTLAKYVPLDQRVHRFVHRTSKNLFLDQTLERYLYLALRIWFLRMESFADLLAQEDRPAGPGELRQMLAAIVTRGGAAAERLMRTHMVRAQQEVLVLLGGPG